MTIPVSDAPLVDAHGWVAVDRLIAGLLRQHVTVAGKTVQVATVLGEDAPAPAIGVQRLPGGGISSADAWEDLARILITSLGTTRAESDAMTGQIRHVMAEHSGGEFADISLDRIREETGPGRVPDPNEDLVAVPTTWVVTVRRQ